MPVDLVRTSIKQPRELWKKVKTDAVAMNTTVDIVLTEILEEHYKEKKEA